MALQKTITTSVNSDYAKTLADLQLKIDKIKQNKIGAEKELELLKEQYAVKVEELRGMGITDLSSIDQLIADLEAQIQDNIATMQEQLANVPEL